MEKSAAKTQQKKIEIEQLSQAELVELVLGLQKIIEELQEKLAIATGKSKTNSKTSSQPPSLDLIQKSEKAKDETQQEQQRKPGGQPGHPGKTRKGFGRIDRSDEINKPEICQWCGSTELSEAISLQTQQVACLVAKPIEVVEYQTQSCKCLECGGMVRGTLPEGVVPGQDLNTNLQALLVWLWAVEFRTRLNQALQTWLGTVGYAASLLLKSLRDRAAQWWYFLDDPSVPPDNNLA